MTHGIFVFFCAISIAAVANAAEVAKSVDASQFDVAGVRLGMTRDEAIRAVMTTLQVDSKAIELDKFPPVNPVTKSKEPRYFLVENELSELTVRFSPKIPADKDNPMVVAQVIYKMKWSPDNAQSMRDAALNKYGQPSNGTVGSDLHWCLKPSKNMGEGCAEFVGPKIKYFGVSVELFDPSYQRAVIDFLNKSKSGKPAF